MKRRNRTIPLFLFLLPALIWFQFPARLAAQPSSLNYPVPFSMFAYAYPMTNPASTGVEDDYRLSLGYQRPVSGFTGISTYYFQASFLPYQPKRRMSNKSVMGLRFYNDNEGTFIRRSRFYMSYAFHTSISQKLKMAGGIDFGGINFSVKATPTTEGASVYKADANAGIWLYNERFQAGLSVSQLFRSVFQPLEEQIILPTHLNVSGSYRLYSGENLSLTPHILLTFPYYEKVGVQASLMAGVFDLFTLGAGWNRGRNVSFMFGLEDLEVFERGLDIRLSYSTSVRQEGISISILEFSAGYSFK